MAGTVWTPQRLRGESAYWSARILATAAHLELFDWLGRGSKSAAAAARRFGGSAQGWRIFFDALAAMGLLRKRAKKYANSAFSLRNLRFDKGSFLLPQYDSWNLWGALPDVLRSGKRPGRARPFLTDRRRAERLLGALDHDAREIAPYLIRRLSLSRARNLLDIGGGLGSYALACCRRFPRLRATVVEHPRIVPYARRSVNEAHLADRVEVIGLDVFDDPLPRGFDVALLSNVLHGQGTRQNRDLLKNIHRSLNEGGRLVVRDVFMSRDRTEPDWGALFSVALLLHSPDGRCYDLDEIRQWLRRAGFANLRGPIRSSPLFFDPDSVLIARKR